MTFYLSTWLAPIVTDLFAMANFDVGTSGTVTMLLSGLWPAGLFVLLAQRLGIFGILLLGVVILVGMLYFNKLKGSKEKSVQEA